MYEILQTPEDDDLLDSTPLISLEKKVGKQQLS